jgi:hypothetical protein
VLSGALDGGRDGARHGARDDRGAERRGGGQAVDDGGAP